VDEIRRSLRLGLTIPPTSAGFYVWLAILLDTNGSAYLPFTGSLISLNVLLGNAEWIFLYGWLVGILYLGLGEKLKRQGNHDRPADELPHNSK